MNDWVLWVLGLACVLLLLALIGRRIEYLRTEVEALRQEVRECSSIEDDTPPGPP